MHVPACPRSQRFARNHARPVATMNIAAWVERHGRQRPHAPAIALGGHVHATWAEWAGRSASLAAGLIDQFGLRPGDRVAIVMHNSPEYLEAKFAIWHAGMVAVPVNARLHRDEIAYILDHSGTELVVTDEAHAEDVAALVGTVDSLQAAVVAPGDGWTRLAAAPPIPLVDRGPEDPAWLFYTSGTTGRPKGATITNRALLMASLSYFADIDPISPDDSILHAGPLSHGGGLYGLPHVAKGAVSVLPASGGVDPTEIAALLRHWHGVSLFAAPTMGKRLVVDPAITDGDLSNLKTIIYGGAPMYLADLEQALDVFGPRLAQIYGQGEAPMTITALSKDDHADRAHPRWSERVQSVGVPRTDVEVRVVDEHDRELPPGEIGEIVVRGPVVTPAYAHNAAETRRAKIVSVEDGTKGRWHRMGDMGYVDEEGRLWFCGRKAHRVLSAEGPMYSVCCEAIFNEHPLLLRSALVGLGRPGRHIPVLVVELKQKGKAPAGLTEELLALGQTSELTRTIRHILVHPAFPVDIRHNAKIFREELAQWAAQQLPRLAADSGTTNDSQP